MGKGRGRKGREGGGRKGRGGREGNEGVHLTHFAFRTLAALLSMLVTYDKCICVNVYIMELIVEAQRKKTMSNGSCVDNCLRVNDVRNCCHTV